MSDDADCWPTVRAPGTRSRRVDNRLLDTGAPVNFIEECSGDE